MILTLIAVILGVLRLIGVKTAFYQAIAHCFVGGLFGAYFIGHNRLHRNLAVGLTILETLVFLVSKLS